MIKKQSIAGNVHPLDSWRSEAAEESFLSIVAVRIPMQLDTHSESMNHPMRLNKRIWPLVQAQYHTY